MTGDDYNLFMGDCLDPFDFVDTEFAVSGPYICGLGVPCYLRATYDRVSNVGTLTLLVWASSDGWWPRNSLVYSPPGDSVIENVCDDSELYCEEKILTLSSDFHDESNFLLNQRGGHSAHGIIAVLLGFCRNSSLYEGLGNITQAQVDQCIIDDDELGLAEEIEKFGIANPYPLDDKKYNFWVPDTSWREVGLRSRDIYPHGL